MMPRFYLRITLLPILLLTAVLLVIRSQPYDDSELRELLLPTNCPAPCFMGIQPGVTTVDEAVAILEASGWVEEFADKETIIRLKWNAYSPLWLKKDDATIGTSLWVAEGIVTDFRLDTSLTLADIILTLNHPPFQGVGRGHIEGINFLNYWAIYSNFGILINVSNICNGQKNRISYTDHVYLGYVRFKDVKALSTLYNEDQKDIRLITCS